MIMMKQNLKMMEVRYGNDTEEVMALQALVKRQEKNILRTAYLLPKAKGYNEVECNAMLENIIRELTDEIRRNKKVILKRDFNWKKGNWEDFAAEGGENTWRSKLLKLVTDNDAVNKK